MTTQFRDIVPSEPVSPIEILRFRTPGPYQRGLKRVFDLLLIVLTAPATLSLIFIVALLVRRDGGPAFYRQERVGRNGRIYRIWKLRTMVLDAEEALAPYLAAHPEAHAEWTLHQKLKDDPRVTRIGRLLRKCSIDELPQLWNVFVGEMSLVGPRPMMPDQQEMYPGRAYFTERPGITGTWQVSERNHSTFADRARFDTSYIRDMSFVNDIKILFQTVRVVIWGTGY